MHTRAVFPCGKPKHSKMTGLYGFGDVVAAERSPTQQVLGRNQDAAVGPCSAARAAAQAVESIVHR